MNAEWLVHVATGHRWWCFFHLLNWCAILVSVGSLQTSPFENEFPVSIIHVNDFHARFEQTDFESKTCMPGETCMGGLARMTHAVTTLKSIRTNPIYLNAGDNFQGTLFYTLGRWNVTQHFLNICKADVMTIGNHEFDNGIDGLVPFLEHIQFPAVVCNIDDSREPKIQGKYQKSVIIDRYERRIGVLGVVNSRYGEITSIGNLCILDEVQSVQKEAARLKSLGVDIIIVLSHCGYDVDQIIAAKGGPHISAIVGGHSHSFLYSGPNPPGPDKPVGEYPTIIDNPAGHEVPIVQASALTKFVGDITIWFDKNGKMVRWKGAPIFMGPNVEQDKRILDELKPWKLYMDTLGKYIVGHSSIVMQRDGCNSGECPLGNFIADAFVQHYATKEPKAANEWTPASVVLINTGGLRTTIEQGPITYADLVSTIPFENSVDLITLRGQDILDALEYSVATEWHEPLFVSQKMLQISGLRVTFNITNPIGRRVQSVSVLCHQCRKPTYEPLIKMKIYPVITISFLTRGGDGYRAISEHMLSRRVGPIDNDIVLEYLKSVQTYKPVDKTPRMIIVK